MENSSLKKINSMLNSGNVKTFSVLMIMLFIISGYVFFFSSTKIFGENYDFELSPVGTVMTLEENHTVSLTRSDIDIEKSVIEYEFYFENKNFDGNNDYKIQVKTTGRTGTIRLLNTETICADSDVYVIRAKLPQKWTAAVADITLPDDNKKLEAKFYSNRDTLYSCSVSGTTREDFLKLDTERSIERLNNEIANLYKENNELERKILEIDAQMTTLQNRMVYMTAEELEEARASVDTMISEKESCITEIDNNKKLISDYQNDIAGLNSKE